jgi:hypothetical protein
VDKARSTERILRIVANRDVARAMAGDLLETGYKGEVAYWVSVARLFLNFVWRPLLGFLVAAIVSFWISAELFFISARHLVQGSFHAPELLFRSMQYVNISSLLWVLVAFALVRFGIRDRLWIMCALYAGLTTGVVYSYWMPKLHLFLWLGFAIAAMLSIGTSRTRRASAVIAIVLSIGLLTHMLFEFMTGAAARHRMVDPWIEFLLASSFLVVPMVEVIMCVLLYQRIVLIEE